MGFNYKKFFIPNCCIKKEDDGGFITPKIRRSPNYWVLFDKRIILTYYYKNSLISIFLMTLFVFILQFETLPKLYKDNTFLINIIWIFYGIFIYLVIRIITTDPGIIPKDKFSEKLRRLVVEESLFMSIATYYRNEKNYCTVCHHNMPYKTIHCKRCNCCVLDLDHHCKVLGVCIGKRNYHFFVLMLFILFIINLIGLIISTIFFYEKFISVSSSEWINMLFFKYPLSGALQFTTLLLLFPIVYMNILHCKLISCEVGTYAYFINILHPSHGSEIKKFSFKRMFLNYYKLFKKPIQPSLLRIGHASDDKLSSIIRN
ncbi:Palmitoyltransferase [Strongyloides ratti]|uniref:Palmitoyltransferase n=1 Tax=Strongyloides ratti TaxID=34506 RepID=A0A090LCE0_STRRB|nr:Palmitoyltransferase [Strongyloides ratti]CEF65768.1 Palmitoyltransferase [Strongyloides ratti]